MKFSVTALPSPEHELACDEALLDACDRGEGPEVLRFWEPTNRCVVLGYGNSARSEVNLPFCEANSIRVLRRCTGGGTVLQSPGCLNYSLILRVPVEGPLSTITSTNRYIMEHHRLAIANLTGLLVEVQGCTDLAIDGKKISGNAQRRRMSALLFHGSFLLGADLGLIEEALRMPSKEPAYRKARAHRDFLRNLNTTPHELRDCLIALWGADGELPGLPLGEIENLVNEKYGQAEWSLKF